MTYNNQSSNEEIKLGNIQKRQVDIQFLNLNITMIIMMHIYTITIREKLTSLKQAEVFLICSSMAHLTVACLMLASYSLELAVPEGVHLDRS